MKWLPAYEWVQTALWAGFAGFGGTMGYIMRSIEDKEKVNPWRALVEGAAAAFVGIIVMLMCQEFKFSIQWTGVVVGVFGWLGANVTIRVIERVILKRLGITGNERIDGSGKEQDPPLD